MEDEQQTLELRELEKGLLALIKVVQGLPKKLYVTDKNEESRMREVEGSNARHLETERPKNGYYYAEHCQTETRHGEPAHGTARKSQDVRDICTGESQSDHSSHGSQMEGKASEAENSLRNPQRPREPQRPTMAVHPAIQQADPALKNIRKTLALFGACADKNNDRAHSPDRLTDELPAVTDISLTLNMSPKRLSPNRPNQMGPAVPKRSQQWNRAPHRWSLNNHMDAPPGRTSADVMDDGDQMDHEDHLGPCVKKVPPESMAGTTQAQRPRSAPTTPKRLNARAQSWTPETFRQERVKAPFSYPHPNSPTAWNHSNPRATRRSAFVSTNGQWDNGLNLRLPQESVSTGSWGQKANYYNKSPPNSPDLLAPLWSPSKQQQQVPLDFRVSTPTPTRDPRSPQRPKSDPRGPAPPIDENRRREGESPHIVVNEQSSGDFTIGSTDEVIVIQLSDEESEQADTSLSASAKPFVPKEENLQDADKPRFRIGGRHRKAHLNTSTLNAIEELPEAESHNDMLCFNGHVIPASRKNPKEETSCRSEAETSDLVVGEGEATKLEAAPWKVDTAPPDSGDQEEVNAAKSPVSYWKSPIMSLSELRDPTESDDSSHSPDEARTTNVNSTKNEEPEKHAEKPNEDLVTDLERPDRPDVSSSESTGLKSVYEEVSEPQHIDEPSSDGRRAPSLRSGRKKGHPTGKKAAEEKKKKDNSYQSGEFGELNYWMRLEAPIIPIEELPELDVQELPEQRLQL